MTTPQTPTIPELDALPLPDPNDDWNKWEHYTADQLRADRVKVWELAMRQAQSEINEQARLLGMGSEREARLMCGYALLKPSRTGRTDISEAEVLRRIKAAQQPQGPSAEDVRELSKWLNEEVSAPINRQALARVLAAQQPQPQELTSSAQADTSRAGQAVSDEQIFELSEKPELTQNPLAFARAVLALRDKPAENCVDGTPNNAI